MEEQKNMLSTYSLGAVLAIAVLGAVIWYFWLVKKPPAEIKNTDDAINALSKSEITVESNPVENKIPELNPVKKTNPFKDAYQNPFAR